MKLEFACEVLFLLLGTIHYEFVLFGVHLRMEIKMLCQICSFMGA